MFKRKNTGRDFESYVQYVYKTLLNLRGEQIQVSRGTTFRLSNGESYEIDVYYEFSKAGVRHRVAIECKDWDRRVDQGKILEFAQRIKNVGNDVIGVFVSRMGYQDGAKAVADRHNILLLTANDLPTLLQLMSEQIVSSAIHEPGLMGEPFWVLAERSDTLKGCSTGSYHSQLEDGKHVIPLFISKQYAELYRSKLSDRDSWCVYGMPQYKLKTFLSFVKLGRTARLALVCTPPEPDGSFYGRGITVDEVEQNFVVELGSNATTAET